MNALAALAASLDIGDNLKGLAVILIGSLPGLIAAVKASAGKKVAEEALRQMSPATRPAGAAPWTAPPPPTMLDELRAGHAQILGRIDKLDERLTAVEHRTAA